jgi:prepilin-type N-terminal cleavage/methylation domain-containing protein
MMMPIHNRKFKSRRPRGRGGFTLIEILVVLAIAAVVSTLTLGGYKEMSDSNKRTSCQTNMVQIYQGLRQYAADWDGRYPYYKFDAAATPQTDGIGLWALYTYQQDNTRNELAVIGTKEVARYLRNPKVFHCPADITEGAIGVYTDDTKARLNPDYLSYQEDDAGVQTYLPSRILDRSANYDLWKRQLELLVPDGPADADSEPDMVAGALPRDDTVITWCKHHRYVRERDNVLFFDGSVQLLPRSQGQGDALKPDCTDADALPLSGAARLPKRANCL